MSPLLWNLLGLEGPQLPPLPPKGVLTQVYATISTAHSYLTAATFSTGLARAASLYAFAKDSTLPGDITHSWTIRDEYAVNEKKLATINGIIKKVSRIVFPCSFDLHR